jgi:hypothetical protein
MRRATLLLMLVLPGGLLSACGKGSETASTSHSHSTASSGETTGATGSTGGASSASAAHRQALAFAQAVNLTAADLPGFTASSKQERETAQEKRLQQQMLGCAGPGGSSQSFAAGSSKGFELKHEILDLGVSSEVSVAATAAGAKSELAAIRGARVRGCFKRYLGELFKGRKFGGASVSGVSIVSGTPPAPGTSGGFGWRVTVPVELHNIQVPFYLDILGFVDRTARVTLFSSGAIRPFPAAVQQQLFSLLINRAKAQQP